jgi:hypothetical protein
MEPNWELREAQCGRWFGLRTVCESGETQIVVGTPWIDVKVRWMVAVVEHKAGGSEPFN